MTFTAAADIMDCAHISVHCSAGKDTLPMTHDISSKVRRTPTWLSRPAGCVLGLLGFGLRAGLIAWASLALYWSNLPWPWARLALALAFLAFGIWALWIARRPRGLWLFAAAFSAVLAWWLLIPPSQDRDWRPEVAVLPRAVIDGDRVRLINVRNFDFRSRNDFTVRHEDREVQLSHLTGVDFYLSFWREGPIGHTWVSFLFDNAPPVSISIETRPEVGEGFNPLASLFKQFELIYVIGDEQDLVGLRASHRDEQVFLFHVMAPPKMAQRLFLIYLERVNELAKRPEWYHLLSNSCTINIVRYMNRAGREGDLRVSHLLNGLFDGYLFSVGLLDTSMPLAELRERSRITAAAKAAENDPDFSNRIRAGLPTLPVPVRTQPTISPAPAPTESR